jgi:hypothetical protein
VDQAGHDAWVGTSTARAAAARLPEGISASLWIVSARLLEGIPASLWIVAYDENTSLVAMWNTANDAL